MSCNNLPDRENYSAIKPIIFKPSKRWIPKCSNPKCYICNPTKEMKEEYAKIAIEQTLKKLCPRTCKEQS